MKGDVSSDWHLEHWKWQPLSAMLASSAVGVVSLAEARTMWTLEGSCCKELTNKNTITSDCVSSKLLQLSEELRRFTIPELFSSQQLLELVLLENTCSLD